MGPLVVARRWDQLGSRLTALVNARCLAERFDLPFAFVWPRGPAADMADPAQLLAPATLERFEIDESALAGRPSLSGRELAGRAEPDARRVLERAGDGAYVDVDELFDVCEFSEPAPDAARRFRRCFEELGWNATVRDLIGSCAPRPGEERPSGVHVRAGDIVDGEWRHLLVHEKYAPTPYVEAAIESTGAGGRPVLVVSDHPEYLAWLAVRFPAVVTAPERVPGYEALTDVQRSLADILALAGCATVVGSRQSAFSRLAAHLGAGRWVGPDALVEGGRELDVLREGIRLRTPEARAPGFWSGLVARDASWCADVFADRLSLRDRRDLAELAVELEPDFAGALSLAARVAAMDGDDRRAREAAEHARAAAEAVDRHGDPLLEALATEAATECLAAAGARAPRTGQARARLPARAREAQRRCGELTAYQRDAPAIRGHLETMIALTEALSQAGRAQRRLAADRLPGLLAEPRRPSPSRLAAHRAAPLFDPVALDLEQIVLALDAAGAPGD